MFEITNQTIYTVCDTGSAHELASLAWRNKMLTLAPDDGFGMDSAICQFAHSHPYLFNVELHDLKFYQKLVCAL